MKVVVSFHRFWAACNFYRATSWVSCNVFFKPSHVRVTVSLPLFCKPSPGGGLNLRVAGLLTSRPSINLLGVYLVCLLTAERMAPAMRPKYLSHLFDLVVHKTTHCIHKSATIPLHLVITGRPIRGGTRLVVTHSTNPFGETVHYHEYYLRKLNKMKFGFFAKKCSSNDINKV